MKRRKRKRTPSWSPYQRYEALDCDGQTVLEFAAAAGLEDRASRIDKTHWFLTCTDDSEDEVVPVSAVLPGAEDREFRGMGFIKGE